MTIKAIFSKEVRWFNNEKNVEIEKWFDHNGSLFKKQKERFDYYLNMFPQENISCKIREGKTEFKKRIEPLSILFSVNSFNGQAENWIKWSAELKDDRSIPNQLKIDGEEQFIVVSKKRVLVIFKVNPGGDIEMVKDGKYPPEGCQVEYTIVKLNGEEEERYSFAFEAFGSRDHINRNFDMVTKHVIDQMSGVKFDNTDSYSYPGFITAKLINP